MTRIASLLAACCLCMAGLAVADATHSAPVLLPSAPNFRDIGGYPAGPGRHVAAGKIYRSSELSSLTSSDAAMVAALHLKAVLDLRTVEERQRAPSIWAVKPADVFESPKQTLAPFTHALLAAPVTEDSVRTGVKSFYRQMPRLYQEEYAAMFHRIARGEVPLLVHCTAGKDRTGLAMAVLLESLGTPRKLALQDYTLTNQRLALTANAAGTPGVGAKSASVSAFSKLPPETARAIWEADPTYLAAALESIDADFGSVEGYVRQGLGISEDELQSVRRSLLEEDAP
jgi:protein-tyrosine phosphatase